MFQSTRLDVVPQRQTKVSIHAPRVGRDLLHLVVVRDVPVSIHAPRVGRDSASTMSVMPSVVSIHAPRTGRDVIANIGSKTTTCFNPRAPCGARPRPLFIGDISSVFQSTRPVWGATRPSALPSPP